MDSTENTEGNQENISTDDLSQESNENNENEEGKIPLPEILPEDDNPGIGRSYDEASLDDFYPECKNKMIKLLNYVLPNTSPLFQLKPNFSDFTEQEIEEEINKQEEYVETLRKQLDDVKTFLFTKALPRIETVVNNNIEKVKAYNKLKASFDLHLEQLKKDKAFLKPILFCKEKNENGEPLPKHHGKLKKLVEDFKFDATSKIFLNIFSCFPYDYSLIAFKSVCWFFYYLIHEVLPLKIECHGTNNAPLTFRGMNVKELFCFNSLQRDLVYLPLHFSTLKVFHLSMNNNQLIYLKKDYDRFVSDLSKCHLLEHLKLPEGLILPEEINEHCPLLKYLSCNLYTNSYIPSKSLQHLKINSIKGNEKRYFNTHKEREEYEEERQKKEEEELKKEEEYEKQQVKGKKSKRLGKGARKRRGRFFWNSSLRSLRKSNERKVKEKFKGRFDFLLTLKKLQVLECFGNNQLWFMDLNSTLIKPLFFEEKEFAFNSLFFTNSGENLGYGGGKSNFVPTLFEAFEEEKSLIFKKRLNFFKFEYGYGFGGSYLQSFFEKLQKINVLSIFLNRKEKNFSYLKHRNWSSGWGGTSNGFFDNYDRDDEEEEEEKEEEEEEEEGEEDLEEIERKKREKYRKIIAKRRKQFDEATQLFDFNVKNSFLEVKHFLFITPIFDDALMKKWLSIVQCSSFVENLESLDIGIFEAYLFQQLFKFKKAIEMLEQYQNDDTTKISNYEEKMKVLKAKVEAFEKEDGKLWKSESGFFRMMDEFEKLKFPKLKRLEFSFEGCENENFLEEYILNSKLYSLLECHDANNVNDSSTFPSLEILVLHLRGREFSVHHRGEYGWGRGGWGNGGGWGHNVEEEEEEEEEGSLNAMINREVEEIIPIVKKLKNKENKDEERAIKVRIQRILEKQEERRDHILSSFDNNVIRWRWNDPSDFMNELGRRNGNNWGFDYNSQHEKPKIDEKVNGGEIFLNKFDEDLRILAVNDLIEVKDRLKSENGEEDHNNNNGGWGNNNSNNGGWGNNNNNNGGWGNSGGDSGGWFSSSNQTKTSKKEEEKEGFDFGGGNEVPSGGFSFGVEERNEGEEEEEEKKEKEEEGDFNNAVPSGGFIFGSEEGKEEELINDNSGFNFGDEKVENETTDLNFGNNNNEWIEDPQGGGGGGGGFFYDGGRVRVESIEEGLKRIVKEEEDFDLIPELVTSETERLFSSSFNDKEKMKKFFRNLQKKNLSLKIEGMNVGTLSAMIKVFRSEKISALYLWDIMKPQRKEFARKLEKQYVETFASRIVDDRY